MSKGRASSLLTKYVFLQSADCDRRGWLLQHPDDEQAPPGLGERFLFEQGNDVERLAREMLGPGRDLSGPSAEARIEDGRAALADRAIETLFQVPIVFGHAIARPDALQRMGDQWRLVEVKSAKSVDDARVDDVAYTLAVVQGAGLSVARVELALVNPDWRVDNGQPPIVIHDVTEQALARAAEFGPQLEAVYAEISAAQAPDAELKSVCRSCAFFGSRCFADGPSDPVFQLPNIHGKRVDGWIAGGITRIAQVGEGEKLTVTQQLHRRAVLEGGLVTEPEELARLDDVRAPAAYLDFETVALALPPFPGIAPYDPIPIQYSVHRRSADGRLDHRELLLDPAAPDLPLFARDLLDALDGAASIVVYSPFEKHRLKWLAAQMPALAPAIEDAIGRLVDLHPIVRAAVAHPEFHGSVSIKRVLPVLVPPSLLTYDGLAIADGGDATGAAGLRALGRVDDAAWETYRRDLLAYCAVDTMAMVHLHDALTRLR